MNPLCLAAILAAPPAEPPLRLADGRPLVTCYFFGHWWQPWMSDDDALRRDVRRLRDMGVSCLAVDHEWSQAIDGDWRWLDREHRVAREEGLAILPWLSLKSWSDVAGEHRLRLAREWYGVELTTGRNQDGTPAGPLIWHPSTIEFGAAYASAYYERFRDQALLHLEWNGVRRPVLCLGVETAWPGGFDEQSNARFRDWLRRRYPSLAALNRAWGSRFASYDAIDPMDTAVFDYARPAEDGAASPAVEDHVEFRSQQTAFGLSRMAARVREKHPEVLMLAEAPYQWGSRHPHAVGYRIGYAANPVSCDWADIVFFRCTGPLTQDEADALAAERRLTGQRTILTYRTYSDWAVPADSAAFGDTARLLGGQAALHAGGFGFYSWNEMVDVHVAHSGRPELDKEWTAAQADQAAALMAASIAEYRRRIEER